MSIGATSAYEITLSRPDSSCKLGIRLASTSVDDPPSVVALHGVAATSSLRHGDVILAIDGHEIRNSVAAEHLFEKVCNEHTSFQ